MEDDDEEDVNNATNTAMHNKIHGLINSPDKKSTIKREGKLLPQSASMLSTCTAASSTTRLIHDAIPALLSFWDIKYSVEMTQKEDGKKRTIKREILRGVNGFMKPGELTAIMGPSGCGKTTLIDILAGRKFAGNTHGLISLNGKPREMKRFKRMSAYVMQNDCLFSFLTVKEILMYTAEMRISDSEATQDERKKRVDRIMRDLDLLPLANTRVGDERTGGISRGQRRRVTVAIELITFPSILFLVAYPLLHRVGDPY